MIQRHIRSHLHIRTQVQRHLWVHTDIINGKYRNYSDIRQKAELEMQILDTLRQIPHHYGIQENLVALGRVKDLEVLINDGKVSCTIESLSSALPEIINEWKADAMKALQLNDNLSWIKNITINTKIPKPRNARAGKFSALHNISDIIAVSSCKGGVGKSTVAVNLAFSLHKRGARVGILDADIYGPSLPTMIQPSDAAIRKSRSNPHFVVPVNADGVKCMSFGLVNQKAAPGAGGVGAAVMRGSMVAKLIDQLLLGTEWGELDYLVIDMPPGTGDIQISLAQQAAISTAVIVTTPQRLSFVDVEKGIAMFQDLKIPTSAVVENMSYFDCMHGHRHYPFGQGHTKELMDKYNLNHIFKLPITSTLSHAGDSGRPFVTSNPEAEETVTYDSLAKCIALELVGLKYASEIAPELSYDASRGMILRHYSTSQAKEKIIHPADLRAACRCASCIDEFSGKQLLDISSISSDIYPTKVERKGNYAFAVNWSDGHTSSLYTDVHLLKLLQ